MKFDINKLNKLIDKSAIPMQKVTPEQEANIKALIEKNYLTKWEKPMAQPTKTPEEISKEIEESLEKDLKKEKETTDEIMK